MNDKMKTTVILAICSFFILSVQAQVILCADGSQPDPSAMLDIKSTTGGLLSPRLTEAQRLNLVLPPSGLLVYQTNNVSGYYFSFGAIWRRFITFSTSGLTQGSMLFASGNEISENSGQLHWDNTNSRLGIGTTSPGQKLSVNGIVQATAGGLKFPDGSVQTIASKGCLITFAADNDYAGDYLRPCGDVDKEDQANTGIRTVYPIPLSGKIVAVAWRSQTASSTTTYTVHYGNTFSQLTLTGQNGYISGLNYTINAGEYMELYHASGTLPNHIILTFYLNE
jgi:hypothetical protein